MWIIKLTLILIVLTASCKRHEFSYGVSEKYLISLGADIDIESLEFYTLIEQPVFTVVDISSSGFSNESILDEKVISDLLFSLQAEEVYEDHFPDKSDSYHFLIKENNGDEVGYFRIIKVGDKCVINCWGDENLYQSKMSWTDLEILLRSGENGKGSRRRVGP